MKPKTADPERWRRISAVFEVLVDRPVAEHDELLTRQCGEDVELRAAVTRLLAADAVREGMLDGDVGTVLRGRDPLLGQQVGPFTIVEHIADGGMGSVYRGARSAGDFDQDVAIKVLRLGIATPQLRDRFARERQTLARLVHPNVARLLDGGTTASGIPFIAMELIDGVPIDRFCVERQLSVRERLQLFASVCRAVQFAHGNLVVHLDLKPGNILVDEDGVPRLLDFGVAGLLQEAEGVPAAPATRTGAVTPEYASPEQLRAEPASTAADVWALGIVLHEVLTGERPRVGDGVPGTERAVHTALRGDIDRIVRMALRHEPARRYASCQQFADDLERLLRGLPVVARSPSWFYLASRFLARHRLAMAAVVGVVAALTVGLLATLRQAEIARSERDLADRARQRAENEREHARTEATSSRIVATFLGDTLLAADRADPERRTAILTTIRRRAEQARRQHSGDDHLRANVLEALGRSCTRIAAFDEAAMLLDEVRDIRLKRFGEHSLEHALSLTSLGHLQFERGDASAAAISFAAAYELHRTLPPDVHTDLAEAANNLAAAERACGRRQRARELHRQALELRRSVSGVNPTLIAESLNNLAALEADPASARELLQEAVAIREQVLGESDPLTLQTRVNLAVLTLQQGDGTTAVTGLRAAEAGFLALGAAGEDGHAMTLRLLATALLMVDDTAAAAPIAERALAAESLRLPDDHPRVLAALDVVAKVHERTERLAEAVAIRRRILAAREAALPAGHVEIGRAACKLGAALARTEEVAAAVALLERTLRLLEGSDGAATIDVADARFCFGDALGRAGQFERGESLLLSALASYEGEPSSAARVPAARAAIREFYLRWQRPDRAAAFAPREDRR
ncbi:MAG: serine/threonine protein kinase [Planctomycetes bacterium]|nr:serine/threonine protein kinase [Planctomycetota bacterium]